MRPISLFGDILKNAGLCVYYEHIPCNSQYFEMMQYMYFSIFYVSQKIYINDHYTNPIPKTHAQLDVETKRTDTSWHDWISPISVVGNGLEESPCTIDDAFAWLIEVIFGVRSGDIGSFLRRWVFVWRCCVYILFILNLVSYTVHMYY